MDSKEKYIPLPGPPAALARGTGGAGNAFPLLIHIGLHKTGTSWLQHYLFQNERVGFATPVRKRDEIRDHLVEKDSFEFSPAEAQDYLVPKLLQAWQNGRFPVITAEQLSGNPHSGGYRRKELAVRLHQTFPYAKVLIVIREQRPMILSNYKQYVKAGGPLSIKEYLNVPVSRRRRGPAFSQTYFKYDRLIDWYYRLFGHEKVLVLLYEVFRESPQRFVNQIISFSGARETVDLKFDAKENVSLQATACAVKRRLNPFITRDFVNGHSILYVPGLWGLLNPVLRTISSVVPDWINEGFERRLRAEVDAIADQYRESNRATSQLTGLDLASYGYLLPDN